MYKSSPLVSLRLAGGPNWCPHTYRRTRPARVCVRGERRGAREHMLRTRNLKVATTTTAARQRTPRYRASLAPRRRSCASRRGRPSAAAARGRRGRGRARAALQPPPHACRRALRLLVGCISAASRLCISAASRLPSRLCISAASRLQTGPRDTSRARRSRDLLACAAGSSAEAGGGRSTTGLGAESAGGSDESTFSGVPSGVGAERPNQGRLTCRGEVVSWT